MLPSQRTIMVVILQLRYDSRGISSNDSTCSSQWRYADTDNGYGITIAIESKCLNK